MNETRRDFLKLAAAATVTSTLSRAAFAQTPRASSLVTGYISNEDSFGAVIEPRGNSVEPPST